MPLYEYACSHCGAELEIRQRISEDPVRQCPECGTEALERLVSQSSFALKGGGWYADGYGTAKKDAKADTKTEAKSESKSETKAETKKEAPSTGASDSKKSGESKKVA